MTNLVLSRSFATINPLKFMRWIRAAIQRLVSKRHKHDEKFTAQTVLTTVS